MYDAPLTYGDFVAEVPFENNIITLDMHGEDIYRALSYSESTKTETCSWGGYLLWDDDIDVRPAPNATDPGDIVVSIGGEPARPRSRLSSRYVGWFTQRRGWDSRV